jgi:hypothetical protein
MGLTLIEAAKYENRLEHLAVLKTFSEGELLAQLAFMNIAGSDLFYFAGQELRDGTTDSWISASRVEAFLYRPSPGSDRLRWGRRGRRRSAPWSGPQTLPPDNESPAVGVSLSTSPSQLTRFSCTWLCSSAACKPRSSGACSTSQRSAQSHGHVERKRNSTPSKCWSPELRA